MSLSLTVTKLSSVWQLTGDDITSLGGPRCYSASCMQGCRVQSRWFCTMSTQHRSYIQLGRLLMKILLLNVQCARGDSRFKAWSTSTTAFALSYLTVLLNTSTGLAPPALTSRPPSLPTLQCCQPISGQSWQNIKAKHMSIDSWQVAWCTGRSLQTIQLQNTSEYTQKLLQVHKAGPTCTFAPNQQAVSYCLCQTSDWFIAFCYFITLSPKAENNIMASQQYFAMILIFLWEIESGLSNIPLTCHLFKKWYKFHCQFSFFLVVSTCVSAAVWCLV